MPHGESHGESHGEGHGEHHHQTGAESAPGEPGRGADGHEYRRDMAGSDWEAVFERQSRRADLGAQWLDELALRAGSRALDVGCGPGFFSLMLAERVGPDGVVYAVDTSEDALRSLARRQEERGLRQIVRLRGDGADLDLADGSSDAALVTMMLHHADAPQALLANVARCVRPGGRLVAAEYHPDGPADSGPPREDRIAPATARLWCEAAGLAVLAEQRQTPEHYALVCERTAAPAAGGGGSAG